MSTYNYTIFKQQLLETGDLIGIKPFVPVYGPAKMDGAEYYEFDINEDMFCHIYFEDISDMKDKLDSVANILDNIVNLIFTINGEQHAVHHVEYPVYLRILKTIKDTVIDHVSLTKPDMIMIRSDLPEELIVGDSKIAKEERVKNQLYHQVMLHTAKKLSTMHYTYSISPGKNPVYNIIRQMNVTEYNTRIDAHPNSRLKKR